MPILGLIIIVIFGAYFCSSKSAPVNQMGPPLPPTQAELCNGKDWRQCSEQELMTTSKWASAMIRCKEAAYKVAKWGTPELPWFPFSDYEKYKDYKKTGKIWLVETDAKYSNGFGGMKHVKISCGYNLDQERIFEFEVK